MNETSIVVWENPLSFTNKQKDLPSTFICLSLSRLTERTNSMQMTILIERHKMIANTTTMIDSNTSVDQKDAVAEMITITMMITATMTMTKMMDGVVNDE